MTTSTIILKRLKKADKAEFKTKIQESFGIALTDNFGTTEPIPSDDELETNFSTPDNETYCIYNGDKKIGGAIVKINPQTQHNTLELFFIYADIPGKGLGLAAWNDIEKKYPNTKVWETITPYFEKRNINFYVNKCGFHIVEFCNKHHRCSKENYNQETENDLPRREEFFRFEKIMKP